MGSLVTAVENIKADLKGEKATRRKEGLKSLNALLDSPDYLRALDQHTIKLAPSDPVPTATWPGLASLLAGYVSDELKTAAGKKRGPDVGVAKTFRRLVQLAEDDRRSGRKGLLVRRAPRLFSHIRDVLGVVGLTSPIGQDYGTLLRTHMLAVPAYCEASSSLVFQELLDKYMTRLEESSLDRSEDTYRVMATVQALLARFPGDMHPLFQSDMVEFFVGMAAKLNALREDSRLTVAALSGLNAFLLTNGTDVSSQCGKLHAALHALVLRALKSARDPKLRDAAVTYLRLQLRLGALAASTAAGGEGGGDPALWLADLLAWFEAEVQQQGFKWGEDSREGRLMVSKQQHALLQLGVALYHQAYSNASASGATSNQQQQQQQQGPRLRVRGTRVESDSEGDEEMQLLASKRRRVAPSSAAALLERCLAQPAAWAPVAAQLLLSYGRVLAPALLMEWGTELEAVAGQLLPPQQPLVADEQDPDGVLWALRFAQALALAWPLHLTAALGSAARGGEEKRAAARQELGKSQIMWKGIWQAVHAHALAPHLPQPAFEAAATVLATIAQRRLAPLPPGFHTLWGLPVLEQPPSPPLLEFVAAALQSGDNVAVDSGKWQEGVLRWLGSAAVASSPTAAPGIAAFSAVLRLPGQVQALGGKEGADGADVAREDELRPSLGVVGSLSAGAVRWWAHDGSTEELDEQIEVLTRGELLLDARVAAAKLRQLRATLRPWPQQPPPAEHLQLAAAASLENLLEDILRQPPSPQPALALHSSHQPSQLAQLLTACAIVTATTTAAAAAAATAAAASRVQTPTAAGQPAAPGATSTGAGPGAAAAGGSGTAAEAAIDLQLVPVCWSADGSLSAKLQQALQRCGGLLEEGCRAPAGFLGTELARLQELAAALARYQAVLRSDQIANSLLGCMQAVQELFLQAQKVVPAAVMTQAVGGLGATSSRVGGAAAMEALFDDDLDVGGAAPPVAARGGTSVPLGAPSSAALVTACKARCVSLLSILGPLSPINGCHAALHWLQQLGADEAPLSEELHTELVGVLCSCAVSALRAPQPAQQAQLEGDRLRLVGEALMQMGVEGGLLGWTKFHSGRQLFVMQQVLRLVPPLAGYAGSEGGHDALLSLVQLVDDCLRQAEAAQTRAGGSSDRVTSWQLRAATGRAVAALFRVDVKLFGEEMLDTAIECVTHLLGDSSYQARLVGSRLVGVLFDKWSDPQAVFESLKGQLCLRSTRVGIDLNVEEAFESSIIALGECGVASGGVELHCLFLLAGHAAAAPAHVPLACRTMDWVASELRYPNRHAYVRWHLLGLLYAWFTAGFPLDPLLLVQRLVSPSSEGASSVPALLSAMAPMLVAVLMMTQNKAQLEELAAAMNKQPRKLLESHFEEIMGLAYPCSALGDGRDKELARIVLNGGLLVEYIPDPSQRARLVSNVLVECIAQMLLLARTPPVGPPARPYFPLDVVVASVLAVTSQPSAEECERVLWSQVLTGDPLVRLLLVVHESLGRAAHPRHQQAALGPLRALLTLLGARIVAPSTFRYAATILLRLLSVRELQQECCSMLTAIVGHMLAAPTALPSLGALLPAILASLVEALECEYSAGRAIDAPNAEAMLQLVDFLTLGDGGRALRPFLQQVDPFPAIPQLQAAGAVVDKARQGVGPLEHLARLARRAPSMTPSLRRRALQALRGALQREQQALFVPTEGPAGGAMKCHPEVAESAWRLAVLSADLADQELALFAGELLALVGPLDPAAIAFDPSAPFKARQGSGAAGKLPTPTKAEGGKASQTQSQSGAGTGRGGRAGSSRGGAKGSAAAGPTSGAATTWVAALQQLADYLIDEDVTVIRAAQYTLRLLLGEEEGKAALALVDDATRPLLEVFADRKEAVLSHPSVNQHRWRLDNPDLWRCGTQPYEAWVCNLAYALLLKATSPSLSTCAHMAHMKPAFAELLLPHAFADLARHDGDTGALSAQLASAISIHMLPQGPGHPKAMQLLLSCLNFLRGQYLDAMVAWVAKPEKGGRAGKPPKGASAAAAAAAAEGGTLTLDDIAQWSKVYWVDLDYLEVAAAAIQCRAFFTALLYLEAWCEDRHGRLTLAHGPGPGPARGASSGRGRAAEAAVSSRDRNAGSDDGDGGVSRVERLLLDIYSQVSEPDGIYAVARSHSMLAQLRRFEHEHDWARALVSYDLVLQNLAPAAAAAATASSAAGGGQQAGRQQAGQLAGAGGSSLAKPEFEGVSYTAAVSGLMRSLQQLGAGYLLGAFQQRGLAGVAAAGDSGASASAMHAAASVLGEWDAAPGAELSLAAAGAAPSGAKAPSSDSDAGWVSFGGSLSTAIAGLAAGSGERCKQAVWGASRELVGGLVGASLEAAANVNAALVQLQMLQEVSEAWEVRWTSLPDLGRLGSPSKRARRGSGAASGARLVADPTALQSLLGVWREREAAAGAGGRYELLEPLQGLRRDLMQSMGEQQQVAEALLDAAVSARKTGHFAQATASLYKLKGLLAAQQAQQEQQQQQAGAGAPPDWLAAMQEPGAAWRAEEAKLLWAQGQQDVAVRYVQGLLVGMTHHPQRHSALQRAYLQCLAAKWLSRTRSESSSMVLRMMQESADLLQAAGYKAPGSAAAAAAATPGQSIAGGDASLAATACRIMYRLAHYADGLYRNILTQKASPEWKTAQAVIEAKKRQLQVLEARYREREAAGLVKRGKKDTDIDRDTRTLLIHMNQLKKPVTHDEEEQQALNQRERQYLRIALHNYCRCLAAGDGYDLQAVFRLIQLWFRLGADADVVAALSSGFQDVPSYKFLPLAYQIASRMSAARTGPLAESGFQGSVSALLVRMAVDHPHHTLYQIFALKNGNRGRDGKVEGSNAAAGISYTVDLDKVSAAKEILQRVAAANAVSKEIVHQMSDMIEGYIELAATNAPKEANDMPFPAGLRRSKQNFTRVPVASVSVPVDPGCRYEGVPHFVQFGERIQFVGGINKPKLVLCTDSQGRQHKQLVKSGNDDLRQDAVMQQFFWLLNCFLADEPQTARRSLSIKTYKVVPFSPASGLLEWVEDTMPLADYLIGKTRTGGAHQRYQRPGDLNFYQCFQAVSKAQGGDRRKLRAAFEDVCARFTPVLHHFFLENFRDPGTWFERRLAYTRSTAVNSMAGYIIGLGDRHSQNILLDRRSAEVVHIDLGIAFEQGRFLNTPELVPFRLTQDVVDGMGVAGVEGVMRRCCQETLKVLRLNRDSILTIIEVFIHDPLYKWALSPTRANRRQMDGGDGDEDQDAGVSGEDGGSQLVNADAERTLLRIKQKLEGVEGGEGEARGVEGQVQQLLADAQDPEKLSKMYAGWAAWL